MEMLVVVAIIATLVAIAIPVMNSVLEKARETTDLANVRSAYAEVSVSALEDDKSSSYYNSAMKSYVKIVDLCQKIDDWQMNGDLQIGDVYSIDSTRWIGIPKKGGTCEVRFNIEDNHCILIWSSNVTVVAHSQWIIDNGVVSKKPKNYSYAGWVCNSFSDYLYSTSDDNHKLVFDAIDDNSPNLKQGMSEGYQYHVGFFICDGDNTMIVDSGRLPITNNVEEHSLNVNYYKDNNIQAQHENNKAYNYDYKGNISEGTPIKVAIQIFKVNSNGTKAVQISDAEAKELENIIYISK